MLPVAVLGLRTTRFLEELQAAKLYLLQVALPIICIATSGEMLFTYAPEVQKALDRYDLLIQMETERIYTLNQILDSRRMLIPTYLR